MPYLKYGKIRLRPNGIYEIRYRRNGVRKSFYSKDKKTAEDKFKNFIAELKPQLDSSNKSKESFGSWALKWLEEIKKPVVKESTYIRIKIIVNNHMLPTLKNMIISDIKPMDIQALLNSLSHIPKQRKSVKDYLGDIFNKAMANGLVNINPVLNVVIPRHQYEKGKPLTVEEQKQFENNLQDSIFEDYYLFVLYSGTRRHEALLLKREDIDFENKIIKITSTKVKGEKEKVR